MRLPLAFLLLTSMPALAEKPTPAEQAAIDYVAKNGGTASVDDRLSPEARVQVKFEKITDAGLGGLKKYPQIGGLDIFDATRATEKGFVVLKEFPHLRKLVLGKADLSPAAVVAIGECVELRHLGLVSSGVTDSELGNLKKLTKLEHLTLTGNAKVTDKGMAVVKGFERLQVLYLTNTSLTDKGLNELKSLDGLRTLAVGGTAVTADAAEKFPDDMPNLRTVRR